MQPPDRVQQDHWSSFELVEHLRTVNQIFIDQVRTADQKAAYVFSFLTAILIFWSTDLKRGFGLIALQPFSLTWFLSVAFMLALVSTIVFATMIIVPRDRRGQDSLFWGAWPAAGERLKQAQGDVGKLIADEYIASIESLADICRSKFKFVSRAQMTLVATILLHIMILAAERGH